jgi:hypothetical protein
MLVEINETLKEGVVVAYIKNGKTHFKIVPHEEYLGELKKSLKDLKTSLEKPLTQVNTIVESQPVEKVKTFEDLIYRHTVLLAWEMLNDKINYEGLEYPLNYDKIREFVYNPIGEIPQGFEEYINLVKGVE